MRYIQFMSALKDFPVFSLADVRAVDGEFDRRRLSEWQAKGYIRKISKGHYLFSDVEVDESILFRAANKLYHPSYISLETALAYHQLIPEIPYGITSATTRRTYRFDTSLTHFTYRTVSKRLFFGYLVLPGGIKVAVLEKAMLDFFYLNPHLADPVAFASIRVDREALLDQLDEGRLHGQLQRFGKKALTGRVGQFLEWIRDA